MPRSSCVSHPSWDFFLPIRQAYVVLCDGDHCGAGLIATFEYFTNCLKDTSQVLWIYKTHQALSEQMLGLYSIRSIQEALHTLEAAGIIMTRAPKKGLTGHFGTTSYLFNYETVSEMMKQGQTAAGKIADGPYAKLPTVEGGVNNIGSIEVELENPNGGEVLNSESDTNTKTAFCHEYRGEKIGYFCRRRLMGLAFRRVSID